MMRQHLALVLILFLASGALAEQICYMGGVSASSTNGGWAESTVAVASVLGANGIYFDTNSTFDIVDSASTPGKIRLSDTVDTFDNVVAGVWVYMYTDDPNYLDGRYQILEVDSGDAEWIDLDGTYQYDVVSGERYVHVGGAVPADNATIQDVLDGSDEGADAAGSGIVDLSAEGRQIRIYTSSAVTISTQLDIDQGEPDGEYDYEIVGCNSSYAIDGTVAQFDCDADINGIFALAMSYHVFRHLEIDCGSGNQADYGIYNAGTSDNYWEAEDVTITGADTANFYLTGDYITLIDCNSMCSAIGIDSNGSNPAWLTLIGCSIHDNSGVGIDVGGVSWIEGCYVYDNGGDGISLAGTADATTIYHCTIQANDGDGIYLANSTPICKIFNNTLVSNGAYGISGADWTENRFIGWNHAHGNTSGESDSGATWATLGQGNNVTGDPLFVSTDDNDEDFDFAAGSPLDGAGIGGMGKTRPIGAGVQTETSSGFPATSQLGGILQ